MRRHRAAGTSLLAAVVTVAGLTACGPNLGSVEVTMTPALYPAFDSAMVDYVNRCNPRTPTRVEVDAANGSTVSVNGSAPRSGRFAVSVPQQVGRQFTIDVTRDGRAETHHVRCLPRDFPPWTANRTGQPEAQYYATSIYEENKPKFYGAVFDTNGVPVYWTRKKVPSFLFTPLSNKNFASVLVDGTMLERRLDGSVARTIASVFTDFHDVLLLPNGNYVLATAGQEPCDLSSWGLPEQSTCINHVFREVTPRGRVVWFWNTAAHIPVTQTPRYWQVEEINRVSDPSSQSDLYDPWHYNSVEFTGDGFIMSFRHLNAVYRIDKATGEVVWKLGGTFRPRSLKLVADPERGPAGQHDARLLVDGTVTIYDNGNGRDRAPRMTRYRIDPEARTATLVAQLRDRVARASFCCGSTRVLPGGNVVTGWGGTRQITENRADGARLFHLRVPSVVYRAVPILPRQISRRQFRTGMDAQYR